MFLVKIDNPPWDSKRLASAKSNSRSSATSRHFVICLSSGDTPAALEVGKVYERLRDSAAEASTMLRSVDESGAGLSASGVPHRAHFPAAENPIGTSAGVGTWPLRPTLRSGRS